VRFKFTRNRLEDCCEKVRSCLFSRFQDLIKVCEEKQVEITICELIGGGMRVPFVKQVILDALNPDEDKLELSYTLDSMASNCIGACYHLVKKYEPQTGIRRPIFDTLGCVDGNIGVFSKQDIIKDNSCYTLNEEQLEETKVLQKELDYADEKIRATNQAKNSLEAFIFETRAAANGNRKHSELIKKEECLQLVNAAENWLYDFEASEESISAQIYIDKLSKLKQQLSQSCGEYLAKIEEEEKKKEEELKTLSKQAAEELEKSGGKDDHDFRKLNKPDRMKKVMMNKEEGTSLFKDGNYEPASLRYKRALQHCDKFFDLSEEDKTQVEGVKHTLHLNLAIFHVKLDNHNLSFTSLNTALDINADSTKALYRRAVVYEKTSNFDQAKKDLLKVQNLEQNEANKAVEKLMLRVDAQIKRQKLKQKKMAQRMFG